MHIVTTPGRDAGQDYAVEDAELRATLYPGGLDDGVRYALGYDAAHEEHGRGVGDAGYDEGQVGVEQVKLEVELIEADHADLGGYHHRGEPRRRRGSPCPGSGTWQRP